MILPFEEDDPVRPHLEESGRDIQLECEDEEALDPCVLRDPGGSKVPKVSLVKIMGLSA